MYPHKLQPIFFGNYFVKPLIQYAIMRDIFLDGRVRSPTWKAIGQFYDYIAKKLKHPQPKSLIKNMYTERAMSRNDYKCNQCFHYNYSQRSRYAAHQKMTVINSLHVLTQVQAPINVPVIKDILVMERRVQVYQNTCFLGIFPNYSRIQLSAIGEEIVTASFPCVTPEEIFN